MSCSYRFHAAASDFPIGVSSAHLRRIAWYSSRPRPTSESNELDPTSESNELDMAGDVMCDE